MQKRHALYLNSLDAETGGWRESRFCSPGDCSRLLASWVRVLPFFDTVDPLIPFGGVALKVLLGAGGGGVKVRSGTLYITPVALAVWKGVRGPLAVASLDGLLGRAAWVR